MSWWTCLAVLLFAARAGADDSCATAGDGRCDELATCALGSDAADCTAACAGAFPPELVGPCAHYAAVAAAQAPPAPDTGSHGDGGPLGLWAGSLSAQGNAANSQIVRHYLVYAPPTYDPRVPTPLVYMLGGFTVDMYGLAAYTELMRTADANGFLVAFPQQHYYNFGPMIGWVFAWNIYRKTDWSGGQWPKNPDVDFIRRLTDELKQKYNVDRTRIFSAGHSRGAGMSIILAFELPDTIAGFVSESGFIQADGFDADIMAYAGARKIPGVLTHGMDDPDVDFSESEYTAMTLASLGWVEDQDFKFYRLDNVAHEYQPQYNQQIFDFMYAHPLPIEMAAP